METIIINNFDQFLDALNLCDAGLYSYEEVIKSAIIEPGDLEKYAHWNDNEFNTVSVLKNDSFEVLINYWAPGQCSKIEQQKKPGWFRVVEGQLNQKSYEYINKTNEEPISDICVSSGEYINESDIRNFCNSGEERCASVHLRVNS